MSQLFTSGHALVIGVGADLPNTVNDAIGLVDILKDEGRCAYPPTQVRALNGEQATRATILAALKDLAKAANPQSTVVVYFSGHGYRVRFPAGEFYYLMPYGYDVSNLHETAISSAEFVEKLKAIPAQKLLLLLDCCHAGGVGEVKAPGLEFAKSPLPPEAESLLAQGSGRVLIASSKENEVSFAGKPYSAFTLALIEALSGVGVSKQDGYVRVADLALHTRQMVPQRTKDRQHPILHFEQADNFLLAYYSGGETQPKGLPFSVQLEIEPEPGVSQTVFDQSSQTQSNLVLPQLSKPPHINLSALQTTLIQQVHRDYAEITLEKELKGGYTEARVFLILPVKADGRRDARVVTKLGAADSLRHERDNYRVHVERALPFSVAQVREYYEQAGQAALNYVFAGGGTLGQTVSLEEYYQAHSAPEVIRTLTGLLDQALGPSWYGQSEPLNRSFRAEYGSRLPDDLEAIVAALFPHLATLEGGRVKIPGVAQTYPHPLKVYPDLLDKVLEGRSSLIHNDLHLRNILVDQSGKGWLIDFAGVKQWHNLFDFIKLETCLRSMALAAEYGSFAWNEYVQFEQALNAATLGQSAAAPTNAALAKAYAVILAVRQMAQNYMGDRRNFKSEYLPALFLYCLATMKHHQSNGVAPTQLIFITACVAAQYLLEEEPMVNNKMGESAQPEAEKRRSHKRRPLPPNSPPASEERSAQTAFNQPLESSKKIKLESLRGRLTSLAEEYQAASNQLQDALSAIEGTRLKRQLKTLEGEMAEVERQIKEIGAELPSSPQSDKSWESEAAGGEEEKTAPGEEVENRQARPRQWPLPLPVSEPPRLDNEKSQIYKRLDGVNPFSSERAEDELSILFSDPEAFWDEHPKYQNMIAQPLPEIVYGPEGCGRTALALAWKHLKRPQANLPNLPNLPVYLSGLHSVRDIQQAIILEMLDFVGASPFVLEEVGQDGLRLLARQVVTEVERTVALARFDSSVRETRARKKTPSALRAQEDEGQLTLFKKEMQAAESLSSADENSWLRYIEQNVRSLGFERILILLDLTGDCEDWVQRDLIPKVRLWSSHSIIIKLFVPLAVGEKLAAASRVKTTLLSWSEKEIQEVAEWRFDGFMHWIRRPIKLKDLFDRGVYQRFIDAAHKNPRRLAQIWNSLLAVHDPTHFSFSAGDLDQAFLKLL